MRVRALLMTVIFTCGALGAVTAGGDLAVAVYAPFPTVAEHPRVLVGYFNGSYPDVHVGQVLYGAVVLATHPADGWIQLRTSDASRTIALADADPAVEHAQPDHAVSEEAVMDARDPLYHEQWGLRAVRAWQAWDLGYRADPSIVIAVVDTGVDVLHPDLHANLWVNPNEALDGADDPRDANRLPDDVHGYDFCNGVPLSQAPLDASKDNHGTGVAGVASATHYNYVGIRGVADVRIMVLKAYNATGVNSAPNPEFCGEAALLAALAYARDNGAHVVTMSWGLATSASGMMNARINDLASKGVIMVKSSGKAGRCTVPAQHPGVITVGGIVETSVPGVYSPYADGGRCITTSVAAPASSVLVTTVGGTFGVGEGVSYAVPHVAGVTALVKMACPSLQGVNAYRTLLESTARDVGDPGRDALTGLGVVTADEAVKSCRAGT